jgi:hypothetical protein
MSKIISSILMDDVKAIHNSLAGIEADVRRVCPEAELHILLTTISVARHSTQYWHDHYDEWLEVLGVSNTSGRTEDEVDWVVVGAADVAAAVSVGTATSTALVVPFIGWTAWGIITGGSTLVTSGVSALIYAIQ